MKKLPPEVLELFRKEGRNGGKRRKKDLSPERRSEIARQAAKARWKHHSKPQAADTTEKARREKG